MPITPQKTFHIVLVDDDEDEKQLFELAARNANLPIKLDHLTTCEEARQRNLPLPDFVFLDINMPLHDGFAWLQGIRKHVEQQVPVVMYSTTSNPEKVQKAFEMGANLFITKPDTSSVLSRMLKEVLAMDWSDPKQLAESSYACNCFHLAR